MTVENEEHKSSKKSVQNPNPQRQSYWYVGEEGAQITLCYKAYDTGHLLLMVMENSCDCWYCQKMPQLSV